MSDEDLSFGDAVLKHCQKGKTGTILISTKNNKACQVVVNDGQISAVVMGRIKGLEAVLEAKKVGVKAESFNERQLPYTDDAKISSSDEIMKLIGGDSSADASVTEKKGNSSRYDEVINLLNTDALDDDSIVTSNIVPSDIRAATK